MSKLQMSSWSALALAATILSGWVLYGAPDNAPFPANYRKWVHVKTTLIGPQSASFARNGGIHHFYANDTALEGYRTGRFPDGSILVDDLLEAKEAAGVTTEGSRRRVAVMAKDAERYRATGGWDFEIFKGDNQAEGSLDLKEKAACFACHQKGHDSVFSEFHE